MTDKVKVARKIESLAGIAVINEIIEENGRIYFQVIWDRDTGIPAQTYEYFGDAYDAVTAELDAMREEQSHLDGMTADNMDDYLYSAEELEAEELFGLELQTANDFVDFSSVCRWAG